LAKTTTEKERSKVGIPLSVRGRRKKGGKRKLTAWLRLRRRRKGAKVGIPLPTAYGYRLGLDEWGKMLNHSGKF
jgi:hypothetical protein